MTMTHTDSLIADTTLTRHDGRRVAWAEWGRPDGMPVMLLHRNPGSRLLDPDPAATAAAGVHLITLDRPGYGRTDPLADPAPAAIASDAVAVIDELALGDVALVGWSAGGLFAPAIANALGERVRSVSLVCTPAPDDVIPWYPDPFRPLVESVPADPPAALQTITAALTFYADDPDSAVATDPGPADAETRSRPGVTEALTVMMREGARQGAIGMAADIVAGSRGEPLPLGELRAPVRLWYGAEDWVGPEHGRWYADQIPGADLTVVPDAGHLLPLLAWDAILDRVRLAARS